MLNFMMTVNVSLVVLFLCAVMLTWFVQFESRNFYLSQQNLAKNAVKGTVHNFSQLVSRHRQIVTALVQSNQELLSGIADFPVDEDSLALLNSKVQNWLPDNFTYMLSSSDGVPLLQEKILKLGMQCKAGLKRYSIFPDRHHETVVMHGETPEDYHFDVMVDIKPEENSPIFFVSFKVNSLQALLENTQIPGQSLLVVNSARPKQIELSAAGVFNSSWHGEFLTDEMVESILFKSQVSGTGWSIISLPNSTLFSDYNNQLIFRSSLVFLFLFGLLSLLVWRLWIEENSRLNVEKELRRTNEDLENKVVRRTQELAKSESDLQNTFMSAPYGMIVINDNGKIELINKRAEDIFEYDENELLNQSVEILIPENKRHLHENHMVKFNENRETRIMGKGRHLMGLKKNGREFAVEIGLSQLEHSDGYKVIASILDISELVLTEQKLMEEHERATVTLRSIGDGVITTDIDGIIDSINPIAERLSGWRAEDAIGRHISQVFMVVNEKTGNKVDDPVIKCLNEKAIVELGSDTVLVHRYGMEIPIEDSAAPIFSADRLIIGAVLVFHDVSLSRAHANEIEYQANHDAMTGLLNRREFDRRLDKIVENARQTGSENNLLYMDLDYFKRVNDNAGHAAGDELLKQLTQLMASQLRGRDTFARLGGDEFAVILELCSTDVGLKIAQKLHALVKDFRFFSGDQVYKIGISIGVVSFSKKVVSGDDLLSKADRACYMAKESGRNRVQLYSEAIAIKRTE